MPTHNTANETTREHFDTNKSTYDPNDGRKLKQVYAQSRVGARTRLVNAQRHTAISTMHMTMGRNGLLLLNSTSYSSRKA